MRPRSVACRSKRGALRSIVADATLAGLSQTERAHQWRDLLADRSGARFIFVAHDTTDTLDDFAAGGPERCSAAGYSNAANTARASAGRSGSRAPMSSTVSPGFASPRTHVTTAA